MSRTACPACDVTLCRCTDRGMGMLHSVDASLYPTAGLFRVGRTLYNGREFSTFGRHTWEVFISNAAGVSRRYVYCWTHYHLYGAFLQLQGGLGVSFAFTPTVNDMLPSVSVRRIHGVMRRFLRRKWEGRALAVMMGLHGRLGSGSCVAEVPADMLCKILAL